MFQLSSEYEPKGDQSAAIRCLTASLKAGNRHQTLLGVTGSGKTFTTANVIENIQVPTLVISPNKTLAAQLFSEFKQFFPNNAVEYFVSYFDYYQPEAYIPRTDTYIEKDSSINQEIERLRLSTTSSLLSRRDVIVVASVSCIYGLGSPEDYRNMIVPVEVGQALSRESFLARLVDMLYERNDIAFQRGRFRVRGDVVEVHPANLDEQAVRVEFFGDEVERISHFDPLTGHVEETSSRVILYPAKQFVTPADKIRKAIGTITTELDERIHTFERENKLLEAQRLKMRTEYDMEMLQEMGFCSGIENYTRHLSGREPGSTPYTLLDFFPDDFLLVADESHVTMPQIGGMYEGDRSRKQTLVDYGFRLPSALDNRPLRFQEFMQRPKQILYLSATPAEFEIKNSFVGNATYIQTKGGASRSSEDGGGIAGGTLPPKLRVTKHGAADGENPKKDRHESIVEDRPDEIARENAVHGSQTLDVTTPGAPLVVEQIIRPTGLLDPEVVVRPLATQIDETIAECRERSEKDERSFVTTLTKRTAEDLTDYLRDVGLKVRYLHSDINTVERVEILRSLRNGEFDILVGINLLREGLDVPEVSLVCILDADKEGFLRSQSSLIQTAGRAARHVNGKVILFGDTVTKSMQKLLDTTAYRRRRQIAYNEEHGISPQSVKRAVQKSLHVILKGKSIESSVVSEGGGDFNFTEILRELEQDMSLAAANLEYERAALLRDQILELKRQAGIEVKVVRTKYTASDKKKTKGRK